MNEAKLKGGYLNIGCKDIREKKLDSETELNADVLKQNNRTNEIYHELLMDIVNLKIMPGDKLSENQLGTKYGVSRTIIRGALLKLSEMNFVEIKAKSGSFVTKMDKEYIKAALIVRLALEKESCMKMLEDEDKTNSLLEKLKKIYNEQTKCTDHENYTKVFATLDTQFHDCILNGFGESKMTDIINTHLLHIDRWRNYAVERSIGIYKILKEHQQIIRMIELRNKTGLLEMLDIHINKTIFNIGKNQKEFWDYFK